MGVNVHMESVACSETAILSISESLVFPAGGSGYNIAMQVYGSWRRLPSVRQLAWIAGSTPVDRRRRAEREKPRSQRNYLKGEELSALEKLPCELADTFDPNVVRASIVWLCEYVEKEKDRYVEQLWLDRPGSQGTAFDARACAAQVFADLAPIHDLAGRSIGRGERLLCYSVL